MSRKDFEVAIQPIPTEADYSKPFKDWPKEMQDAVQAYVAKELEANGDYGFKKLVERERALFAEERAISLEMLSFHPNWVTYKDDNDIKRKGMTAKNWSVEAKLKFKVKECGKTGRIISTVLDTIRDEKEKINQTLVRVCVYPESNISGEEFITVMSGDVGFDLFYNHHEPDEPDIEPIVPYHLVKTLMLSGTPKWADTKEKDHIGKKYVPSHPRAEVKMASEQDKITYLEAGTSRAA